MLFGKNPFFKKLKKSTPEDEYQFRNMMQEQNVPLVDKLVMIATAFAVLVLPCALILVGMSAIVMWIFGII